MTWSVLQGNVFDVLPTLESGSVHCCVTSPPYWGLRDYGVDAQLGLEKTPEEYVENIVKVFREVRRVLRDDGTIWLNLGDSYFGANWRGSEAIGTKQATNQGANGTQHSLLASDWRGMKHPLLKPKDLVGIPWMTAFALRADGWYLRSDIIWAKPNPMPESVTDRPTKSHEYIFLLSKSQRYHFDQEAVKEPATSTDNSSRDRDSTKLNNTPGRTRMGGLTTNGYHYRNVRSVWNIATKPFAEAHFATFPPQLVRQCILAGTSEHGVCAVCGAPWTREVEVKSMVIDRSERTHGLGRTRSSGTMVEARTSRTVGWKPPCKHGTDAVPATVLDPFSGSGTTGLVAYNLGRNFVGIELNPEYVAMSERRLNDASCQQSLFG